MNTLNGTWWTNLVWRGYVLSEDGNTFCESLPTRINSFGLWEKLLYESVGLGFWEYPLPNLELMIFSVFLIWQFFVILFKMSNIPIPEFPSMMLGGLVISLFSYTHQGSLLHQMFFPDDGRPKVAETGGAFGFVMYLFLKGVFIDVGMLKKMQLRAALVGFVAVAIPFFSGFILMTRKYFGNRMPPYQYITIIVMQSVSAFSGVNGLLKDLKINHSEFGRIAQSYAAVADLLVFITSSGFKIYNGGKCLLQLVALVFAYLFFVYIVRPVMWWIVKETPEVRPVKDVYINSVMAIAYLVYLFWIRFFSLSIYGWFFIGLAIPAGPPLGSALIQRFECCNVGVFLPIFVSLIMVQLDVSWLMQEISQIKNMEGVAYEAISLILFLSVIKFSVTAFTAFAVKFSFGDSIVLALVMSHRSIFELGFLGNIVELKMFDNRIFTIAAATILVNSLLIPIAINSMYKPHKNFSCYQERNLLTLPNDSKLKTLACIHKPDHITSMINFMDVLNPTKESQLECNVLHLVELVGQASPAFISHKLQRPKFGTRSCSRNVITMFLNLRKFFPEEAMSICWNLPSSLWLISFS